MMQNRRLFLKQLGSLAAGTVLLPSFMEPGKKVKNVGVQLYSFRNDMLADATGTLKKIAALGIKQVESASSPKGAYYGLAPKEMKQLCKDLGMTLRSGHVPLNEKWQQTMNDAAEAGQEYLICQSMPGPGKTTDDMKKAAETFNKAGAECNKLGIKFGYHNHNSEFKEYEGKVLYDTLLIDTDPKLVHMELDLGWVVSAGKNPMDYFKNFSGRFPLWHLKDMNGRRNTELGKGTLDITGLLKSSKLAGMKYFFVEQEQYASTPLESMQANMEYLTKLRI